MIDTFAYKLLLLLHISSVVVAFGTGFVHTATLRGAREGSVLAAKLGLTIIGRYQLPGLIAASIFGVLLVVNSKSVFDFDAPWISGAFSIVILLLVLAWFVSLPAQRALVDATERGGDVVRAAKTASIVSGLFHLGFLVLTVLMIWKPGQ